MKSENQTSNTVLSEIKYLRNMTDFIIDQRNCNRYRILVKESVGHTAYCFSTPIYNIRTRRLVRLEFRNDFDKSYFEGSNGTMTVSRNKCTFENGEGRGTILLEDIPAIEGMSNLLNSQVTVSPTLNGLLFAVHANRIRFRLHTEVNKIGTRFHSTCFSIMKETFKPFLSISALYARDRFGKCFPVEIFYTQRGDDWYDFELVHSGYDAVLYFEINLYESKLFQDTTVESKHPNTNNAYGSIGFIGQSIAFGEQWLYSRPDFFKLSDLASAQIDEVLLHIPIWNDCMDMLDVFVPQSRFCSFGSTWNNKVQASPKIATSVKNQKYLTVQTTDLFTNFKDSGLTYNEGLIFKKQKKNGQFLTISTGDCYFAPQILEIKFK